MRVFGVTGLPGSGKSIISRLAKKEGIHTLSMGDVIRKEAEKSNSEPGEVAVKLRKQYGNNVVADRIIKEIKHHSKNRDNKNYTIKKMYKNKNKNIPPRKFKKVEQDIYIIEGIRSPTEVNYFRKHFKNFKIIAIHSNPQERFNRLIRRKRDDDSADYKMFLERDNRELDFGIGTVIALADYMLINEGHIQYFKSNVRALIKNEIKPRKQFKKYHKKNKNKNKNQTKPNRRPKQGRKQYKKYDKKQFNYKKRK